MKFKLPSGRVVKIGTKFGNNRPKLERPLPPEIADKDFRSIQLRVTVMDGDKETDTTVTGISWCSPFDQWNREEGRKKAVKRLFAENRKKGRPLTKEECAAVVPILLTGQLPKTLQVFALVAKQFDAPSVDQSLEMFNFAIGTMIGSLVHDRKIGVEESNQAVIELKSIATVGAMVERIWGNEVANIATRGS